MGAISYNPDNKGQRAAAEHTFAQDRKSFGVQAHSMAANNYFAKAAADRRTAQQRIDAQRASPEYRAREASVRAALGLGPKGHAGRVGMGGHGGNPNHDDHGRFT